MLRANFGPRMANVLLPALADLSTPDDIVVMNFGLWSNDMNELSMHTEMFESSFRYYVGRLPNKTFWRETSAQHYSTLSGKERFIPCIQSMKSNRKIYGQHTGLM